MGHRSSSSAYFANVKRRQDGSVGIQEILASFLSLDQLRLTYNWSCSWSNKVHAGKRSCVPDKCIFLGEKHGCAMKYRAPSQNAKRTCLQEPLSSKSRITPIANGRQLVNIVEHIIATEPHDFLRRPKQS